MVRDCFKVQKIVNLDETMQSDKCGKYRIFDGNIQHSFRVVNCLLIGFNSVKHLRTSEGSTILSVIDSNGLPPAIMALNQAA